MFYGTALALLPALIAIVLALITKQTYLSLFVGILIGALFIAGFNPVDMITNTLCNEVNINGTDFKVGFIQAMAEPWNSGIFIFITLLGITIAVINKAGGSVAFGKWASKHIKSRIGSMLTTFILGVLIFIDDYFNCLTVGSVMRSVTDEHKVSRAKLSYIIDATAAPICMIAPISSWAAAVSTAIGDLDSGVTGIQLFIQTIPYNFYSILTIVFMLCLIFMHFDYGKMAKAELEAYKNNNLGILKEEEKIKNSKASFWDMLIPIIMLIVCCLIGMLYSGGFWDSTKEGYQNVALAFTNTDASLALPWGCIISLCLTFAYLLIRRVVKFNDAMDCVVKGFEAIVPSLLILIFALTLKLMINALGADVFVTQVMSNVTGSWINLLPLITFIIAALISFATGTSWGTFGIMLPIVIPAFSGINGGETLLVIGVAACLAGAVCGDHCSPISDTTIMASAGANVMHLSHVSTQLPYVATVACLSLIMFGVAGFVQNAAIMIPISIVLTIVLAFILKKTIGTVLPK